MENIEKMIDFGPIEMAQQVNIDVVQTNASNKKLAVNILLVGLGIALIAGTIYFFEKNKKPAIVHYTPDQQVDNQNNPVPTY